MLRLIKYLLVLALLAAVSLPVALVVAGLQPEPLVPLRGTQTPGDVARAKALIEKYDPRGQRPGELRSIEVPERDLAFVVDYVVGRLLPAAADVDLRRGGASVALTARVPENPLGRFLNLRVDLSQVPGGLEIDGLRVGGLELPEVAARAIGWLARRALQGDETVQAVLAGINGYRFTQDRLLLVYQWQPEMVERVKSRGRTLLIADIDRDRLLAYSARIAAVTRGGLLAGRMPLAELLGPVFAQARERTRAKGDAAAENRAAVIALMLYAQGVDVRRFLDEPSDTRFRARARTLTLQGRDDLAQHFLISAGIAAAGGSRLADAVGLFKELDDSRSGSGFSFTDLAADRAGVRFAESATGPNAARLQGLLADKAEESLFMPRVRDLPEFMPEDELVRRFGGVDTPRYRQVADDIEQRIAALEIHR
jgi:hypothetical protein